MNIEERLNVVLATYKFDMFPMEDWANPRESLKLVNIELLDKGHYELMPILAEDVKCTKGANEWLKKKLDEFAKNFVKANDGMFADVMYKRIEFDIPLHGSSAVVQYVRRYGEFVPEQVFIWYFVSVDEFTGFFIDDFQAGKGYKVLGDE